MTETPPKKKFPLWGKVVIGLFAFPFVAGVGVAIFSPNSPASLEQQIAQAKADSIQAKADSIQLVLQTIRYHAKKSVTDNLKDPESFEEIEHKEYRVTDPDPLVYYQASIKYRAKNSFGGYVIEKRCFNFLENGIPTKSFECD